MRASEAVQRNSAVWYTDVQNLKDQDLIVCKINDVYLEGIVTLKNKELKIEMIFPFCGMKKSRVIDEMTPLSFSDFIGENGHANTMGMNAAKEILMDLYFENERNLGL